MDSMGRRPRVSEAPCHSPLLHTKHGFTNRHRSSHLCRRIKTRMRSYRSSPLHLREQRRFGIRHGEIQCCAAEIYFHSPDGALRRVTRRPTAGGRQKGITSSHTAVYLLVGFFHDAQLDLFKTLQISSLCLGQMYPVPPPPLGGSAVGLE